jgi:hypothetical protein
MMIHKPAADQKAVAGPTCLHLRSKGMYVTGQRDLDGTDIGDGHCWCSQTQQVMGPDSLLVSRTKCDPTRRCYQAAL